MESFMNVAVSSPLLVSEVTKFYGKQCVLNEVSLALNAGEIFGLVGLNGAGKTTLIKIMLDLANVSMGKVEIFGEASTTVKARERISYLPEKFSPSRYLKGYEHLALALSYYGKKLDVAEADSLVGQLAAVQLSHLLAVLHFLLAGLAGHPGSLVDLGGKCPSKRQ
jgi:ABC-type multidrug transport system ATPase subunit